MPIINPTEYIHSCVSRGECTRLKLEKEGVYFPEFFSIKGIQYRYFAPGTNYVVRGTPEQVRLAFFKQSMRFEFPCCTMCKLPVTPFDSIDLNKKLRLILPTLAESLDGFDELLKGFDLIDFED